MTAPPFDHRTAGVLLHVSSLPHSIGCGDLGAAAHDWVATLASARQTWWQTLPVGPTGQGDSPYDSESAFAGNPLFIDLQDLARAGLLTPAEARTPATRHTAAQYSAALRFKDPRLRLAAERFARRRSRFRAAFEDFLETSSSWLPDYVLYRTLREAHGIPWMSWDPDLRDRRPRAMERAHRTLTDAVQYHTFLQFAFHRQWTALRRTCARHGVRLLGDVPMFVAHDSADVWAHRQLFFLDETGERTVVAGVPPDAFSRSGQRWGNPLYRWPVLKRSGYRWWIERLQVTLTRFDAVRLDHFIGFRRYWEVPGHARTARAGRFVQVPGEHFLTTVRSTLGHLPFVAEDLGLMTPEVAALRDRFSLPGMRVLQFAFDDGDDGKEYLPHRYPKHTLAYTGTHDNDTTVGWLRARAPRNDPRARAALARRRARVKAYIGSADPDACWSLIRVLMMSVANTTIVPLQDVLGLDSNARMNVPGTPSGNWRWRLAPGQISVPLLERLGELTEASERALRR